MAGSPAQERRKTLLLVEDNAIIGLDEARSLEAAGYRVVHVTTGEKAVARALDPAEGIDLVLMDVDLGRGMDGTEAARAILEARDLPVVFLSSHTEPTLVERAEAITNYGYILKSAGKTVLLASIRTAFRLHDAYAGLKAKEADLRRSEERYSMVFAASPFAIAITRLSDNALIDVNEAFVRTFGWSREEILGRTTLDIGLWADHRDRLSALHGLRAERGLRGVPVLWRRKDGRPVEGIANFEEVEIGGEPCVVSLAEDVTEVQAKEHELREREAHYRVLFNDLSDAVLEEDFSGVKLRLEALRDSGVEDLDAWLCGHLEVVRELTGLVRILDFNQEFLSFVNAASREEVSRTISGVVPDEALLLLKDEFLALWRQDRAWRGSAVNKIPGSPVRHLKVRICVVSGHEADWSSVLVGLADITREVEGGQTLAALVEQKDMLMRELEHRVKNNLNIVSSLLSLEAAQLTTEEDRQVFLAAQSRIRSISLIYDLLSHSAPGDRFSCASYFRDLALLLKETFAAGREELRLELDIEDLDIDVKRGVSLGLLANELLTNSLKYAFPDRGGTIRFILRRVGGRLCLRVEDTGVGAPKTFSWAAGPSLGGRLVDMLVQQLGGDIEMATEGGFRTRISIPL